MYEYQERIRYSELDSEGRLTLPALLDYFQDASIFHSEELGLGLSYLRERHMVWALSSWQIVIRRCPGLCERVTVGTAPYEFKGFIGFRNFWMRDEKGEDLAIANSVWSLLDMEKGRPVKPTDEMMKGYDLSPRLAMDYAERHIRFRGEGEKKEKIKVLPHHLDTNRHVNNGQYVRIAMDCLPPDFPVAQLRAEYKMQAVLDTEFYPLVYDNTDTIGVSLQNPQGTPYCNVEFSRKT